MKRACGRVTERKIKFLIWLSLHVFTAPKTEKAVVSPSKILKRVPFVYIWFVLFVIRFVLVFCLFPIREIHRHLQQLREYRPDFNLRNIFVSQDVDPLRVIRTTFAQIFVPASQFCLEANRNNSNSWEFVLVIAMKKPRIVYA